MRMLIVWFVAVFLVFEAFCVVSEPFLELRSGASYVLCCFVVVCYGGVVYNIFCAA